MRIVVLGSGSQGNSLLIEAQDGTRVLVDAGLSTREVVRRLRQADGCDEGTVPRVDAVVITHAHADHVQHAGRYGRRFDAPVYATESTSKAAADRLQGALNRRLPRRGKIEVGGLRIHTAPLPHDAPQVALVFEGRNRRCGLVTDLGHVPPSLPRFLEGCDTLLLEANHCPELLELAPYPSFLKRRIRGRAGHLSNEQAAGLIRDVSGLERLVLMHLSQKANSPRRASLRVGDALRDPNISMEISSQEQVAEVARAPKPSAGQLALPFC